MGPFIQTEKIVRQWDIRKKSFFRAKIALQKLVPKAIFKYLYLKEKSFKSYILNNCTKNVYKVNSNLFTDFNLKLERQLHQVWVYQHNFSYFPPCHLFHLYLSLRGMNEFILHSLKATGFTGNYFSLAWLVNRFHTAIKYLEQAAQMCLRVKLQLASLSCF